MQQPIYLIDISAYIFRAYFAIRSLGTSQGIPTNATYGVVTMLLKFLREKKPERVIVVFDSPTPTFRKEIYSAYKANRALPPEDLIPQFAHIREYVETYPLPFIQKDGYEADDLMATMVEKFPEQNFVLVSADKDLMQLMGKNVGMYDPMRDREFSLNDVQEKFGVGPSAVVDVQALAGDATDNIPGVKGIGLKTAGKLIADWGNLENLYEHVEAIPGKVGEKLQQDKAMAFLSKKLVTLKRDVPLVVALDQFKLAPSDQKALNAFYQKLEFSRLVETTREPASGQTTDKKDYELITTEELLNRWVQKLASAKNGFAFDTETTGIDPMRAELVGLSFAVRSTLAEGAMEACYIPISHKLGTQLPIQKILQALKPLLAHETSPKWAQNAKYDFKVLHRVGLSVKNITGDSMIASYLLKPDGGHGMDALAREYLGLTTIQFKQVVAEGSSFSDVPLSAACHYAAEDADITYRLNELLGRLVQKEGLQDIYQNIELPLVPVLARMEMAGVYVNLETLTGMSAEFATRLIELEKSIHEQAGGVFNIQSPKQLAVILFEKLGLPRQKKTKTGYSTNVDVLNKLDHPITKALLEYRMLAKLKSTYVDGLSNLIHPETHRIHTNYQQTITATGRLSSTDPNLQNIPIRTMEGRRIRSAFEAQPGWYLLSADYSQIELRLLAAFSKDESLMKSFQAGEDIHAMTAQKIFGQSTPSHRARAKTVNFGILYGQSAFGLANQLGIPQREANDAIENFYASFPTVKAYKASVLEMARTTGFVRTWLGRRRLVPELQSQNKMVRANAERFAFNTIFQGSAADLIKLAMIQIDRELMLNRYQARMLLQVHDELVFEVPEHELESVRAMIVLKMENAVECAVPLKVETGVGKNWNEAH